MGWRHGSTSTFLCAVLILGSLELRGAEAPRPIQHENGSSLSALDAASVFIGPISERQGWPAKDLRIVSLDAAGIQVSKAIKYDFSFGGFAWGNLDFSLSEETSTWEPLRSPQLPPSSWNSSAQQEQGLGLVADVGPSEEERSREVEVWSHGDAASVLPAFSVAGPVELLLVKCQGLRLSMPNDVDAGPLDRIVVAGGAAVIIEGAREVSLVRSVQLALPLGPPLSAPSLPPGVRAAHMLARLQAAAAQQPPEAPLVALQVVGASRMVAAARGGSHSGLSGTSRLKVRRLAPGVVELSTRQEGTAATTTSGHSGLWVEADDGRLGSTLAPGRRRSGVSSDSHETLGSINKGRTPSSRTDGVSVERTGEESTAERRRDGAMAERRRDGSMTERRRDVSTAEERRDEATMKRGQSESTVETRRDDGTAATASARRAGAGAALEDGWVWPWPELNSSDPKMAAVEAVLVTVLGDRADRRGAMRLEKVKAQVVTLIQLEFEVERQAPMEEGGEATDAQVEGEDEMGGEGGRARAGVVGSRRGQWSPGAESQRQRWRAIAKVEGRKLHPLSAQQLDAVLSTVSVSYSVASQNGTLFDDGGFNLPPPGPMNLDGEWS